MSASLAYLDHTAPSMSDVPACVLVRSSAGCKSGVHCSVYGPPSSPQAQHMYKVESRQLTRYALESSVFLQQATLFRSVMDFLCVHGEPSLQSMHSAHAVQAVLRKAHAVDINKFDHLQGMLQAVSL